MRWFLITILCFKAYAYDLNLMISHSNMHHLKANEKHIQLAKKYNLTVEEVMAISYSYDEFKYTNLAKLVESYKSLNLKNYKKSKLLPSSVLFSKILKSKNISLLEAIKSYKVLTGLSIVLSKKKIKELQLNPQFEFKPKNIFINNYVSLKDTIAHAIYYDSVMPKKVSRKELSNKVSFSSDSFKNMKSAHKNIMNKLNKKINSNKYHLISKAKQNALGEKFGVIYLVNSNDEIQGGLIFDTFDGSMKELILN